MVLSVLFILKKFPFIFLCDGANGIYITKYKLVVSLNLSVLVLKNQEAPFQLGELASSL